MAEQTARVGNVRQALSDWWEGWAGNESPRGQSSDYDGWRDYTSQLNLSDLDGLREPRGLERWEDELPADDITVDMLCDQLAVTLASYVAQQQDQ